jgi:hypothetical protein
MKAAWTIIWRGRNCVAYWKEKDTWTLDPDEAQVFGSWFAGIQKSVYVVRCWT